MSAPFRFSAGGVAFTDDPVAQATQRVYSILSTQPGERLMRPAYGANTLQYVFGLDGQIEQAQMVDTIRTALQQFAPEITFLGCTIDPTADPKGNVHVSVSFALPTSVDSSTIITQTLTIGSVASDGTVKGAN